MRIAFLADIHANREALDAVRDVLKSRRIDQTVLLGDLVGYGADPAYCVEQCAGMIAEGALAVLGNHDAAIEGDHSNMNSAARAAIEWTRRQLVPAHLAVLRGLATEISDEDRLYVHATARAPLGWEYVTGPIEAERSLRATNAKYTFVGHVHSPRLWRLGSAGTALAHTPMNDVANPLATSQNWLAVIGSVGQPRDGSPAASFAILDTKARTLTYEREPYDHFKAAQKVRAAGLPASLSERLLRGA